MSYELLNPPPLSNHITQNEKVSVAYQKYFTNINTTIAGTIVPVPFTDSNTSQVAQGVVLQTPSYKATSEITSITSANGSLVYDDQTKTLKVRLNGAWKEVQTV